MNDATDRDTIRDADITDVTGYELTTKDAEALFADALVPRSARTIQRMCKSGSLRCTTYTTDTGETLRINRDSVERKIKEIQQIQGVTTGHDTPRHAATDDDSSEAVAATTQSYDTGASSRHAAADDDSGNRRRVSPEAAHRGDTDDTERQAATAATRRDTSAGGEELVAALREQLDVKDATIQALREERAEIRKERDEDLEFYGNLRSFLRIQVQEVFDERNSLRARVEELEGMLPAGESQAGKLPAGQPSPMAQTPQPGAADTEAGPEAGFGPGHPEPRAEQPN